MTQSNNSYKKKKQNTTGKTKGNNRILRYCVSLLLIILLTLAILFLKQKIYSPENRELLYGKAVYVIDGDTIKYVYDKSLNNQGESIIEKARLDESVSKDILDGQEIIVRLIGIDAPESANHDQSKNTEEGRESTKFLKEMVEGKTIGLDFDEEKTDKYDRLLAYLWMDGELINKKMIDSDHAVLMIIPPNTKYEDLLKSHS